MQNTEDKLKKLENRMRKLEYKFAVLDEEEWTKETCGSCSHPYWSEEDSQGICHHINSISIIREQKACGYWRSFADQEVYRKGD
jgi:hypothetical protein